MWNLILLHKYLQILNYDYFKRELNLNLLINLYLVIIHVIRIATIKLI